MSLLHHYNLILLFVNGLEVAVVLRLTKATRTSPVAALCHCAFYVYC